MLSRQSATNTVAEARAVPLVRPERASGTWRGVQHGELLDACREELTARRWVPGAWRVHLWRGGLTDMEAGVTVNDAPDGKQWRKSLVVPGFAVASSNAWRRGLRFYAGCEDAVEGAAVVVGSLGSRKFTFSTVYAGGFNLAAAVKKGVDWWERHVADLPRRRRDLDRQPVDLADAVEALHWAGGKGLLPWSRVADAVEDYRKAEKQTRWRLLVAFGKAAARSPAWRQLDQMAAFYKATAAGRVKA